MTASQTAPQYEGEIVVAAAPKKAHGLSQIAAARERRLLWIARVALLIATIALWEIASRTVIAEFWISRPSKIFGVLVKWFTDQRAGESFTNATIPFHLAITVQEAAYGFVVGALAAILIGVTLGQLPFLGRVIDPFILAIYSVPKIALAPLFILWFGIGLNSKIVFAAVVVFFLVFWNTYTGVREIDRDLVDVVRLMGANGFQVLTKIVLPGSLVWIFTGLKASAPYAVVGAVVGELIASNRGIGYLIMGSSSQFDTAGVFAAVLVLMVLSTIINQVLGIAEGRLLRWKVISR